MIQVIHKNIIKRKRVFCKQPIRNDSYLFKEASTYVHIYKSDNNPKYFKDQEEEE